MSPQNLAWTRDELTLALDLYIRCPAAQANNKHAEIRALSEVLRALPIYPLSCRPDHFRNMNGMHPIVLYSM